MKQFLEELAGDDEPPAALPRMRLHPAMIAADLLVVILL